MKVRGPAFTFGGGSFRLCRALRASFDAAVKTAGSRFTCSEVDFYTNLDLTCCAGQSEEERTENGHWAGYSWTASCGVAGCGGVVIDPLARHGYNTY